MELRVVVLALSLVLMASAAQAQTTPPVPGVQLAVAQSSGAPNNTANVVACVPGNTFASANAASPCIVDVVVPEEAIDVLCVSLQNQKTFARIIQNPPVAPPELAPLLAGCVPASPGQTVRFRVPRPNATGTIVALATITRLNFQTTPIQPARLFMVADISVPRFTNRLICVLEALGMPIAGCPNAGNDITPGEFPDLFPGQ